MMSRKTRMITLSALFAALSVVVLFFASIWPTGQVGLVAISSLFVAAAVIETGTVSGLFVYVIASSLGMLILPNKAPTLWFISFFGYYPVIKCLIEKIRKKIVQWILKLLIFNAALAIISLFLIQILPDFGENEPGPLIMHLVGSAVFVLFDYGYTSLVWFYMDRISKSSQRRK